MTLEDKIKDDKTYGKLLTRRNITPGGCWEYTGYRLRNMYGQARSRGRTRTTHRISWEYNFGEIPPGMLICHKCDNPPCFNPEHLFIGTYADNNRDMREKGRRFDQRATVIRNKGAMPVDLAQLLLDLKKIRPDIIQKDLARAVGVSQLAVSFLFTGISWKHLKR